MQRVAIGRALVREPALTLMDEPLSSLDAKLRNDLRLELKRIQQDLGATMLYVTHDQIEAMTLADAHRRARPRPAGAGRHAAADLRGPGEQLRRGAARLAAHQPACRARRSATLAGAGGGGHASACAPSTCACACRRPRQRPTRARWSGASSSLSDQHLVHVGARRQRRRELVSAAPRRGGVRAGRRGRRRADCSRSGSTPPASASPPERPRADRSPP